MSDTRGRLLLIEDDAPIRAVVRRFLERRGWQVTEAADGAAALACLFPGADAFDVIVCDVHLPGVRGTDLYRQVVERVPSVARRFVLTTGDPRGAAIAEYATQGGRLLEKPFELASVLTLVEGMRAA